MRRLTHSHAPADLAGEPLFNEGASPADSSVEVLLADGEPVGEMSAGAMVTPAADGSISVDLNPETTTKAPEPDTHDGNLAELMSDPDGIGGELVEAVKADEKSRGEWEDALNRGIELLGMKIEDRQFPFKGASGVYDPLMASANLRWGAIARGELLPANGPVRTKITGWVTPETQAKAYRVKEFMNLYLTDLAPEYYEEYDQMLTWHSLAGSSFKKVYQDPILARPVSPFVHPQDFIVSYTTSSLFNCPRATHVTKPTQRDLKMLQLLGVYRDIDLGDADEQSEQSALQQTVDESAGKLPVLYEGDDRHTLYEIHCDLDLRGYEHKVEGADRPSGLPLPYIVTVDKATSRVLSIRRNWEQNDPMFRRIQHFVHYKFIPGLGFYGWGYAHVLGGSAKAATALRRQLIDAGTLNNFPGGLRVKGMKFEDNNLGIGPTEFREVDTGGMPIQQAIMTMPYREPSQVLLMMLEKINEGADKLAGTQEIAVGEGRQDAPVGTTVALMEAAMRVQSATIKRAHVSMRDELRLLKREFGRHLPETPYPFPVPGGVESIMRADFSDDIDVLPVSDPNITSSTARALKAEQILNGATQAPDIHDKRAAFIHYYQQIEIPDEAIAQILPPPQQAKPMDPLSENQAILTGKPVAIGPTQDDASHLKVHQSLLTNENPMVVAMAQAHMAEHMASGMRKRVENMLGIQLPPMGAQLPPEVENEIAMLVAKATEAMRLEDEKRNPTENQIAMEALRIEAQKVAQKASESQGKQTTEAYKANLSFITAERDRAAKLQGDRIKAASARRAAAQKPQTGARTA